MSLQVDDGRRGRSRSPAPRERSRSRGPPLAVDTGPPMPYPDERDGDGPRIYDYQDRYDTYAPPRSPGPPRSPVESPSWRRSNQSIDDRYADDRRERDYRYDQEPSRGKISDAEDKLAFLPQKYAKRTESGRDADRDKDRAREMERNRKDKYDEDLAYGSAASIAPPSKYAGRPDEPSYKYAQPKQWEYAKVDKSEERLTYNDRGPRDSRDSLGVDPRFAGGRAPSPGPSGTREKSYYRDPFGEDPRGSAANIVTAEPGSRSKRDASPLPPTQRSKRDASPLPPTQRMSSLSVNTGHHSLNMSLSAAPPSPLLESYHGTYQSMSPMPSPLLMPSNGGFDPRIQDVSPIGSDDERNGKTKRRARFNNPEEDAARLAKALKGDKSAPDTGPLIEILPGLTHEQMMDLRIEYKRLVKTGPDRKGVNIAKHIRSRLKDEDPSLMKACYSTALGQWESEAYWANFWYQGDKTRRELLIESLMGRTNDEIREIKDGFSDKKYDNSLIKCMRTELKEDKFKKAVLLVLDEKRMDERDRYGRPLPIDSLLVEDDARQLYKAVRAEKGGESAMISIVVQRSDSHLREVLKLYNVDYGGNFARDALKKSNNLVGELLAHILNGVINKPVRDALLLHHALTASKRDELRRELLISRLVRYHWDRHHMAAVKAAYRERYGRDLQESVKDATSSSDWGRFCRELCITRMPDDVRRVERVVKVEKESGRDRDRERERERDRDRDRDREREKDRRSGR